MKKEKRQCCRVTGIRFKGRKPVAFGGKIERVATARRVSDRFFKHLLQWRRRRKAVGAISFRQSSYMSKQQEKKPHRRQDAMIDMIHFHFRLAAGTHSISLKIVSKIAQRPLENTKRIASGG
jgi:hypothetical protein